MIMDPVFPIPTQVKDRISAYVFESYPEFTTLEYRVMVQRLMMLWLLIFIEHYISSRYSSAYFNSDHVTRATSFVALHTYKVIEYRLKIQERDFKHDDLIAILYNCDLIQIYIDYTQEGDDQAYRPALDLNYFETTELNLLSVSRLYKKFSETFIEFYLDYASIIADEYDLRNYPRQVKLNKTFTGKSNI